MYYAEKGILVKDGHGHNDLIQVSNISIEMYKAQLKSVHQVL